MQRYIFALSNLWRKRKTIRHRATENTATQLITIDPKILYDQGIRLLVVDFDGVIAAHGEIVPTTEAKAWLHSALQIFGSTKVVILSNKPMQRRIDYFSSELPEINFFVSKTKKPYPDGVLDIIKQYACNKSEVVLIDDRLATGILAADLAGITSIYITKPEINFKNNPVVESFFSLLRVIERSLLLK